MQWLLIIIAIIFAVWSIYALIPTIIYKYGRKQAEDSDEQTILLTFDDGPDPRYTLRLLQLLHQYQIKAVFFLPGCQAKLYPEIVRQIAEAGHQIGFHGMQHRNPWLLSPLQVKEDFSQGLAVFADLGLQPQLYRPPHGNITLANLAAMKRHGLQLMLWNVLAGDWQNCGKELVLSRLITRLQTHSIILLHDAGENSGGEPEAPEGTLAAVAAFIPWAMQAGYTFIDIGDGKEDEKPTD